MNTDAELREKYEQRKPILQAFGQWVTDTILDELRSQLGSDVALEKFLQIPPKPRVKETDSFLIKALVRKPKQDPLYEITDQVGVRFVVLLLEEIDKIGAIIKSTNKGWDNFKDRDYEIERLERPDYFSYQSDHYVVRANTSFFIGDIKIPKGMACEIQIRTILQHAYAEMAHGSDYKPSIELPEEDRKKVRRALAKGSALIETTEDVFREIKKRVAEYNETTHALLAQAARIYTSLTGEDVAFPTILGDIIVDAYREYFARITPEELSKWMEPKVRFGETLKGKREQSVFYRDPAVILLFWLVDNYKISIREKWPVDMGYLDDFLIAVGISPENF